MTTHNPPPPSSIKTPFVYVILLNFPTFLPLLFRIEEQTCILHDIYQQAHDQILPNFKVQATEAAVVGVL